MNPNNTTQKNIFSQQQAINDLRGVVSPGSVVSGLLLGNFNNPKQIILHKQPSVREIMENLKIFPEAKEYLIKQTKQSKKYLRSLDIAEQEYRYIIERKSPKEDKWFWLMMVDGLFIEPWKKRHEFIVKRNSLVLDDKKYTNTLNIESAKSFPITNLIEFKHGVAKCIFHNDNNPSMHYYPNTNTIYCFSCQTYADSIKVYQTLNNCSFIEAVKKLQ